MGVEGMFDPVLRVVRRWCQAVRIFWGLMSGKARPWRRMVCSMPRWRSERMAVLVGVWRRKRCGVARRVGVRGRVCMGEVYDGCSQMVRAVAEGNSEL